MWKKLKSLAKDIALFWCCGGGLIISLLGFIWTWKLALAIFCAWGCSFVIAALIFIRIAIVQSDKNEAKNKSIP